MIGQFLRNSAQVGASAPFRRFAASAAAPSVGFVGLGAMGSHMAANLASAGFPTTVWDMNSAAVEEAVGCGCTAAPEVSAIAGSELIFTSLPRSVDVESLADNLIAAGTMRSGSIWGECRALLSHHLNASTNN